MSEAGAGAGASSAARASGRVRRRSRAVASAPAGFRYLPGFIGADEEQRLIEAITGLAFEPVVMHGVAARREVAHFGARYRFDGAALEPAPPPPAFLADACARAAAIARFPADAPIEILVTRYPPGAGIGWHRDAPPFGPSLAGLSLAAPCELRLRLEVPEGYRVYKTALAPGSLYVISGTARFRWQHAIPPVARLRYSITFRTVKLQQ